MHNCLDTMKTKLERTNAQPATFALALLALLATVNNMMLYMPPQLLGEPGIYFAIIIAFVFVLVVYI